MISFIDIVFFGDMNYYGMLFGGVGFVFMDCVVFIVVICFGCVFFVIVFCECIDFKKLVCVGYIVEFLVIFIRVGCCFLMVEVEMFVEIVIGY